MRGENQRTPGKTSQDRVGNQQTQPSYDTASGKRTWAMLVEGVSHGFALQLLTATHTSDYKKEAPVVKWGKIFPTHLGC